jgi:methionyl-tRNA formyltransferase
MQMDAGLDTGPIVAVRTTPVATGERAPALESRLAAIAADLLAETLGPWLRGEVAPTAQGSDGVILTRPLRRADGRLDPHRGAAELERQIRAYEPWPGTFVDTIEGRLVILAATIGPADGSTPGTLTPAGLVTVDGVLVLHHVQPAAGRPMPWTAYLRGHPTVVGSALVPGL